MPNQSNRSRVVAVRLPNELYTFVFRIVQKDMESGHTQTNPSIVIKKCVEHVQHEVQQARILD